MTVSPQPTHIDRFIVKNVLGRGAQGSVYLATDPDLNRNVAIKSLHLQNPLQRQEQIDLLFSEARIVSQLQHPNIVTVYELGVDHMQPYLVLEYIDGESLKNRLKTNLRFSEIIQIMGDVLNGVAAAHGKGIIHCDLKPANILLNREGKAKVADFGISLIAESDSDGNLELKGTPRYMAPEYIESRRQRKVSDVFSLGLMFYELLTGKPAIGGENIYQILNLIANTDITAPSKANPAIDQRLDALILKALERNPERRFEDAGMMLATFNDYLSHQLEVDETVNNDSAMGFLLGRIKRKKDFPIFSQTLSLLNKAAEDDTDDFGKVSSVILKDISLTNKILNLANSAYYNRSGGKISTISRAVVMLGINQVRRLAVTLMLFDHIQNNPQAQKLREEAVLSLLNGLIAGELAKSLKMPNHEEAFLCALLHQLGKMMVRYYFYDESKSIDMLIAQQKFSESQASLRILGVSYKKLGIAVAREWGFPQKIVNSLDTIDLENLPGNPDENLLLKLVANFGNQLGEIQQLALVKQAPATHDLVREYSSCLKIDTASVSSILSTSIKELSEFTTIIKFDLMKWLYDKSDGFHFYPAVDGGSDKADSSGLETAGRLLNKGIHDITNTLTSNYNLKQIVKMILKTIYRAFADSRVLFSIKDSGSGHIKARIGYGKEIDQVIANFSFPISQHRDVFNIALRNNTVIRINNTGDASINARIPSWYQQNISAKSFILIPVIFNKAPFGMIYIDNCKQQARITDTQLSALKTLGNQLILAMKTRR